MSNNENKEDNIRVRKFIEIIDTVGLYAAHKYCSKDIENNSENNIKNNVENNVENGHLNESFYQFISLLANRHMNQSRQSAGQNGQNGQMELESKATLIVQSIRLLIVLSTQYEALVKKNEIVSGGKVTVGTSRSRWVNVASTAARWARAGWSSFATSATRCRWWPMRRNSTSQRAPIWLP